MGSLGSFLPGRADDATRRASRERGVAAVTVAIAALLILGLAALVLDGSNLYRERSDVQNAADLAAMAAAWAGCNGASDADAQSAGRAQAATNGYDNTDPDVSVVILKNGDEWFVDIDTDLDGTFSQNLGSGDLSTGASALARCDAALVTLPGMFAGGSCADKTFEMSGSNDTIVGAVHSNDDLKLNGSDLSFGDTTYHGTLDQSGSNQTFTSGPAFDAYRDWPITHLELGGGLSIADFAPGGSVQAAVGSDYYHATNWTLNSSAPDGVYVADEYISVPDELDGSFTFVVLDANDGYVEFSGQDNDMTAFYAGYLVISNGYLDSHVYPYAKGTPSAPKCDYEAITISGSGNGSGDNATYDGIMFAPRGMISVSGQHMTFTGGLIGYTLKYGGSDNTFNSGGQVATGEPITVLVE